MKVVTNKNVFVVVFFSHGCDSTTHVVDGTYEEVEELISELSQGCYEIAITECKRGKWYRKYCQNS